MVLTLSCVIFLTCAFKVIWKALKALQDISLTKNPRDSLYHSLGCDLTVSPVLKSWQDSISSITSKAVCTRSTWRAWSKIHLQPRMKCMFWPCFLTSYDHLLSMCTCEFVFRARTSVHFCQVVSCHLPITERCTAGTMT